MSAKSGSYKRGENTVSQELVEILHNKGVASAEFEPIYEVVIEGKKTISKPDAHFTNGGTHIISAKIGGASAELKAVSTAVEYVTILKDTTELGVVFGVCYPKQPKGKYRAHIIPVRKGEEHASATFDSLEELAYFIFDATEGLKRKIIEKTEPPEEGAQRLLQTSAHELAESIKGIPPTELKVVFGGDDFFESVLESQLDKDKQEETLRLGAAFLYVNQLVFYSLISNAAQEEDAEHKYPPIAPKDYSHPMRIHDKYFTLIKEQDYEPIYGFNVAQFFTGKKAKEANINVVRAIQGLLPTIKSPDLAGQIFQTLIPLELRKPLGAHYTNPKAAKLLAKFAVNNFDDTVMDPACGSGTLLVGAYRQKMRKANRKFDDIDKTEFHKRFVEEQITGLDAMAFSSHLAAVNLALQQPLLETDFVRIATVDSTIQRPGSTIKALRDVLPRELKQSTIYMQPSDRDKATGKKQGTVNLGDSHKEFELENVDVIIMNPPFTSWDNMSKRYRETLKKDFSLKKPKYRDLIYWKISQQSFFLILADIFLKNKGTLASVLPITTFTGLAFKYLTEYINSNYTIEYICIGMGRASYSEDTNLTECLFVARKQKPRKNHKITMVGTVHDPSEWTPQETRSIHDAAFRGKTKKDIAVVKKFPQIEFDRNRMSLTGLMLRLIDSYEETMDIFSNLECQNEMITIEERLNREQMDIHRWKLGSEHLYHYGHEALFIFRNEGRAAKKHDRLILSNDKGDSYEVVDKRGKSTYQVKKEYVRPALRRFSYLDSIDTSNEADLVIAKPSEDMEKILTAFYGKKDTKKYMKRIKKTTKKFKGGKWLHRIKTGSSRLCIIRRFDLAAPGTTVLSCWNKNKMFLAGNAFFLSDSENPELEKFLCLWLNSTFVLTKMIEHMTITRGTWMSFEKSSYMNLPIPDTSLFDKDVWERINKVFREVSNQDWPSLIKQLKEGGGGRSTIDDFVLELLGVNDESKRREIAEKTRRGVYDAISFLQNTMG